MKIRSMTILARGLNQMTNIVAYNSTGPRTIGPRPLTVLAQVPVAGASMQGATVQGPIQGVLRRVYECTRGLVLRHKDVGYGAGVYRTVGLGPVAGVLW